MSVINSVGRRPCCVLAVAVVYLAVCSSCRNEAARSPVGFAPPNVTVDVPAEPPQSDSPDAEPEAEESRVESAGEPAAGAGETGGETGETAGDPSAATAAETEVADDPHQIDFAALAAAAGWKPEGSDGKNPLAGCELCHVDIEDEFIGSRHFHEEVGCVDCHGFSDGHLADENNEVKPDVMFTRQNTDSLCAECHGCSRPAEPEPPTPAERKICTECHGAHDVALLLSSGP